MEALTLNTSIIELNLDYTDITAKSHDTIREYLGKLKLQSLKLSRNALSDTVAGAISITTLSIHEVQ